MNQPTPDPVSTPASARDERVARRLGKLVDEPIVAWTQGWVSRDMRLHHVLAARTFDFAVVTESSLVLVTTGFFTRRPRRRVFQVPLVAITVADRPSPRGRRLRISSATNKPLLLELGDNDHTTAFVAALVAHAPTESP